MTSAMSCVKARLISNRAARIFTTTRDESGISLVGNRDASSLVIPAQAGIQYTNESAVEYWIPAFAGMTKNVLT